MKLSQIIEHVCIKIRGTFEVVEVRGEQDGFAPPLIDCLSKFWGKLIFLDYSLDSHKTSSDYPAHLSESPLAVLKVLGFAGNVVQIFRWIDPSYRFS